MALEIPAVMSPVGVNNQIIQNGENGYLCSEADEWQKVLTKLIEDPELRKTIGKKGRETVQEKYSVRANTDKYLKLFS